MTDQTELPSEEEMTLHCPAFELPLSPLLSQEGHRVLKKVKAEMVAATQQDPSEEPPSPDDIETFRQWQRENFYQSDVYKRLRNRYPVEIETTSIAGVITEIITPSEGISDTNQNRVLINLHSGGFEAGSRSASQIESIPIAVLGKIKVISIDYRMAPEHHFPAATDDVVAVYQTLLQDYASKNIGIFGASAGAMLSAQTLVRLQRNSIPLPGAVGMIASGATKLIGDSVEFTAWIFEEPNGMSLKDYLQLEYYKGANLDNPEATPILSDKFMSAFPPSLLASSTRDFLLSSTVATHRKLIELGVEAELHIWEGLDHIFHYNAELPEAAELHRVTIRFFEKHLG